MGGGGGFFGVESSCGVDDLRWGFCPFGCVRMMRFATTRQTRQMKAHIRIPQAKPMLPFRKWSRITEKKKPPRDVPVVLMPYGAR